MKIVFLSYLNRSGSTFLAQQMSRCGSVLACPEADILVHLLLEDPAAEYVPGKPESRLLLAIREDPKLKYWGLDQQVISRIPAGRTNLGAFISILEQYRNRMKPSARVVLFKSERLLFLEEKIRNAASNGHDMDFICLIRDPRAVYESQRRTPMWPGTNPMTRNPVKTALSWKKFAGKCLKAQRTGRIMLFQYEKMISDPAGTFRKLMARLGIMETPANGSYPFLSDLLPEDFLRIHGGILTAPDPALQDLWQKMLGAKEIYLIQAVAGSQMRKYGYGPVPFRIVYFWIFFLVPVTLVQALLNQLAGKFWFHTWGKLFSP